MPALNASARAFLLSAGVVGCGCRGRAERRQELEARALLAGEGEDGSDRGDLPPTADSKLAPTRPGSSPPAQRRHAQSPSATTRSRTLTLRSSRAKGGSGLATNDLTRLLDDAGVEYELLPHAHTESAAAEAEALGLAATDVAKTLVVKTPEGYVRAVLPASERLDLCKLREFLGVGKHGVHLATEDDLRRDFPEFELGAAPPVGGGRPDPVVIERRLVGRESLVLEAGSHEESIRIAADDFVRIAGAQPADICED